MTKQTLNKHVIPKKKIVCGVLSEAKSKLITPAERFLILQRATT